MRCHSLLAVLAFAASAHAQSADDPTRARPERPTVATHAVAVATGYLEFEAGVASLRQPSGRDQSAVLTTKLGVARHAQLTITASLTRPAGGALGADPLFAGVKWQLGTLREGRPLFAILPGVTFANGPRSEGRDAALSLMGIVSHAIGPVGFDLNAAATRLNGVHGRQPYLWAASFGGQVSGPIGWGAELFGSASETSTTPTRLLGYVGCTLNPRTVFDAGFTAAILGAQGVEVFAGVTWNAGRVFGGRARR
jgi:hypothetical protein